MKQVYQKMVRWVAGVLLFLAVLSPLQAQKTCEGCGVAMTPAETVHLRQMKFGSGEVTAEAFVCTACSATFPWPPEEVADAEVKEEGEETPAKSGKNRSTDEDSADLPEPEEPEEKEENEDSAE